MGGGREVELKPEMWVSADVGQGINLVRQMQNVSSPTTKVIWVVIVAVVVVLTTGRNLEVVVMKKLSSEDRGSERPSSAVGKNEVLMHAPIRWECPSIKHLKL